MFVQVGTPPQLATKWENQYLPWFLPKHTLNNMVGIVREKTTILGLKHTEFLNHHVQLVLKSRRSVKCSSYLQILLKILCSCKSKPTFIQFSITRTHPVFKTNQNVVMGAWVGGRKLSQHYQYCSM